MATRRIRDRLASRLAFQNARAVTSGARFIPTPGGVPILNAQGQAIDAVGIGGDASDKDELCAIEAIRAAGLALDPLELREPPEPPEPAPGRNGAAL